MSDFYPNPREIRALLGLTQSEFAEKLGLSASYVSQIERGERSPGEAVSRLMRLMYEAHLNDQAASKHGDTSGECPPDGCRLVPIISWAHAGDAANYEEIPEEWQERRPTMCKDPDAFILRLEGESMWPRFHEGAELVIAPGSRAYSGQFVVARFAEHGGVLFRRMELGRDGEIHLAPENTRYPVETFTEKDFSWIYPVWGVFEQLMR